MSATKRTTYESFVGYAVIIAAVCGWLSIKIFANSTTHFAVRAPLYAWCIGASIGLVGLVMQSLLERPKRLFLIGTLSNLASIFLFYWLLFFGWSH